MRELLRPLLPMVKILAVPIVPFLLFGEAIEGWFEHWKAQDPSPWVVAAVAISLLASDIFLPVPSSMVCTLAGWELNLWGGTLTSWLGMSLGAVIGFALARRYGAAVAGWLGQPEDLARAEKLVDRFGPAVLVMGRGVPVLAEASVLIAGMHGLAWRRFLPPVLLSNLGLALAYAGIGRLAEQYHALPVALACSIALPVLFAVVFRGWELVRRKQEHGESERP